jgi:hypothetical protein
MVSSLRQDRALQDPLRPMCPLRRKLSLICGFLNTQIKRTSQLLTVQ